MKWSVIPLALTLLPGCNVGEYLLTIESANAPLERAVSQFQAGSALMQLSFERDRVSSAVVLDVSRDGTDTWLNPEGISVSTRDGLLVATRGLGGDMLASDVAETRALVTRGQTGQVERFHTFVDGADQAVIRSYICDVTIRGDRQLTLQGQQVQTTLFEEDCVSQDQEFTNLYWVEKGTGALVQSSQWAGDMTGNLGFRPLRAEG